MWDEEKEHLDRFERLMKKHKIQPSILRPIWDISGYTLGAFSALLGKEVAMATTCAVEEAVVEHYNK